MKSFYPDCVFKNALLNRITPMEDDLSTTVNAEKTEQVDAEKTEQVDVEKKETKVEQQEIGEEEETTEELKTDGK